MRILVTSGGTKVPIDSVRDITNMSKGTFGTKIAKLFMTAGHEVTFFYGKDTKTPLKFELDSFQQPDYERSMSLFAGHLMDVALYKDRYSERVFRNFDDYEDGFWKLMNAYNYDIVVLAAAVSDYGVVPISGKARSSEELKLELFPLPKIISKVKQKFPDTCLVGFKLLVGSTDEELIAAVKASMENNGCDLVVGNDLRDIKQGDHRLLLGFKDGGEVLPFSTKPDDSEFLASIVVSYAIEQRVLQIQKSS